MTNQIVNQARVDSTIEQLWGQAQQSVNETLLGLPVEDAEDFVITQALEDDIKWAVANGLIERHEFAAVEDGLLARFRW